MSTPGYGFIRRPGLSGPFGAVMDEYARAAEDFCRVIEAISPQAYVQVRPSDDPNTVSIQAICAHVVGAAHRYADYIRRARGMPFVDQFVVEAKELPGPAAVRARLAESMQYTEESLEGLYENPAAAESLKFQVRWGPIYDPEMVLEHAIVHLLRHRRQVERWKA
ncbi:MAG: DinB family protein [Acidobacteriota bacterium]